MIPIWPVAPDWAGLLRNLRREETPARVYYFEHGIAANLQEELARRYGLWSGMPGGDDEALRRSLAVHRFLGHELFRVFPPGGRIVVPKRDGAWTEEGRGAVASWEALEKFNWPKAADADLSCMEQLEALVPDNMRAFHVLDVWEVVRDLIGFEQLCLTLYDDPAFVEAVFDQVGGFALEVAAALCDFDHFGALYIADDLGYKTGPMIAPDQLRTFVLPWHRKLARLVHEKGKLVILHSCGNMYDLINDYIEDLGIDAKHSFEDAILPVAEAKKRYGDRLSLLGGIDVDFLARATPDAIREHTREVLSACQSGGGYCLGSGNWVTEYIPVDNYLAMLSEARVWHT